MTKLLRKQEKAIFAKFGETKKEITKLPKMVTNEVDLLCDECNKDIAMKYWHTGHKLCNKCYNIWKNKSSEKEVEDMKEESNKKLFKPKSGNWFG